MEVFRVYVVGGSISIVSPAAPTALVLSTDLRVAVPDSTSTTLLASNANRKLAHIVNIMAGSILYLKFSAAAADATRFPLNPRNTYTFEVNEGRIYTGEVRGFQASGASADIGVAEFT